MCGVSARVFQDADLMRGHGFSIFAILLLMLAALMAMVNPTVALGMTGVVLLGGIVLFIVRWKNL